MKDLGELLKINLDANQKLVKDSTKPMKLPTGSSPKKASNRFKKLKKKMKKEE